MTANAGLQLFPPPPTKKSQGKYSTRRGAIQPGQAEEASSSRPKTPDAPIDGRQSAMSNKHSVFDSPQSAMGGRNSPNPFGSEIPRSQTAFSEAPTLVRSHSNSSRSSIAKPPLQNNAAGSSQQPMIRSIFPRYNPDVPLEQQDYYPTQTSPTHIPQSAISRSPYSAGSGWGRTPLGMPTGPRRTVTEIPTPPTTCSTEELKQLWKVTNGWRVSASEGRSFCLKMTSAVEEPVHTLSSATHPFYTLRLDPTSTSALIAMTRHDPNKALAKSSSPLIGGSKNKDKDPAGVEVLTTALEDPQRRLPPSDGLVALLDHRAAAAMALDMAAKNNNPSEDTARAAAEFECGRLVWDNDTEKYYLVHPSMSTPFCVTIASSPAWSRVEYTLEHPELPHNMVKLTRDGSGGGYLEVDTGVAARIDSFFLVDVAICAVMIVALAEEKTHNIERFEAPPTTAPPAAKTKKPKIEEMEMDLESQQSLSDKEKANLPKPTKGVLKVLFWALKFVVWILTFTVKTLASVIISISGCLTKKGLN
ncbi:hypothetical protein VE04_09566 [Pseudogymnoascus sp. 24MN13]|nr:hypothetical protein VE04_09566 [Pseudogymnoascus sp. 24MN13]